VTDNDRIPADKRLLLLKSIIVQFASFKIKIQMETVLFLINRSVVSSLRQEICGLPERVEKEPPSVCVGFLIKSLHERRGM
jgi:hypothetical protein